MAVSLPVQEAAIAIGQLAGRGEARESIRRVARRGRAVKPAATPNTAGEGGMCACIPLPRETSVARRKQAKAKLVFASIVRGVFAAFPEVSSPLPPGTGSGHVTVRSALALPSGGLYRPLTNKCTYAIYDHVI